MISQRRFIHDHGCTTLVSDADNGGDDAYVGAYVPSSHFALNLKKYSSFLKNKIMSGCTY